MMMESNASKASDIAYGAELVSMQAKARAIFLDDSLSENQSHISSKIVKETSKQSSKSVALTFDDGPNPKFTPEVLSILRENNVKATFCVIGDQVKQHPSLVRKIAADGHKLCDHSVSHDMQLPNKNEAKIKKEILGGKQAIQSAVPGAEVPYYRAPGGNWGGNVRELAANWGMKPLGWSVDPRDWARPGVDSILGTIRKQLKPGGVILLHDGGGDRRQTVEALKTLIPELKRNGYQFDFPA